MLQNRNTGNLRSGNVGIENIRFAMKTISCGTWITFISIPLSMVIAVGSTDGLIRPFTVMWNKAFILWIGG